MFWEITKILAFFGTLSKGSEKAPFYFVFFPHCTSPRFRVSYSMYLNIGCNYIVVLSVLDRRYIGDIMNKEFLQNLREQIKAGTVTEQEPMNKHTSLFSRQQGKKSEVRFIVQKKRGFLFLLWVMEVTCWYRTKVFEE